MKITCSTKKEKFGRDNFKSKLTLDNPSLIDQKEKKTVTNQVWDGGELFYFVLILTFN